MEDKEFVMWCGWRPMKDTYKGDTYTVLWGHENGEATKDSFPPTIDIDFLFEYAVPKLDNMVLKYRHYNAGHMGYEVSILKIYSDDNYDTILTSDKDPAIALRKAIESVIGEKE